MGKVINVTIDENIELDPRHTKNMPDNIKQPLLATMTVACKRYNCTWRELVWKVKFYNNQPVISVKKR
ncbi:hypothetical protein LCGC14_1329810 [marine sediment metagenome]|uniref:Uncharacterized protein n=1 Tax=marine sediment metagenome TaxID=412755 RepID=A0A0F9NJF4_9ZZZZ